MNFSSPVNNIIIFITAMGSFPENFIFTTNSGSGIPTISTSISCFATIVGNQIISVTNSAANGGGGQFLIQGPVNFTSLTITGSGGNAGSLMSLCSNSIQTITPTPTPTPTPSITPSITVTPSITSTPTVTPTNTITPTPGLSPTPTNTITPTPGLSQTPTVTPTLTKTPTPTPTKTTTPTVTPTKTTTPTPTKTTTPTPTRTPPSLAVGPFTAFVSFDSYNC
jgi:hypothetical protein